MKTTQRVISFVLALAMTAPTFAFAQTTTPAQPTPPPAQPAQPAAPVQQYQQQYQPLPVQPAQPAPGQPTYPAQPAHATVAAPPAPTPVVDPAAAEEADKKPLGQRSRTPAIATGVIAGIALVSFVVNGIVALQKRSDFDTDRSSETANDADTHAILADVSLGAAIALGITSAVLFVRYGKSDTPADDTTPTPAAKLKPTIMATPIFTKDSAGAGAVIRF